MVGDMHQTYVKYFLSFHSFPNMTSLLDLWDLLTITSFLSWFYFYFEVIHIYFLFLKWWQHKLQDICDFWFSCHVSQPFQCELVHPSIHPHHFAQHRVAESGRWSIVSVYSDNRPPNHCRSTCGHSFNTLSVNLYDCEHQCKTPQGQILGVVWFVLENLSMVSEMLSLCSLVRHSQYFSQVLHFKSVKVVQTLVANDKTTITTSSLLFVLLTLT